VRTKKSVSADEQKEANTVDVPLTIRDFHAILTSEKDGSPLLTTLRKLRDIRGPQEIVALAQEPRRNWSGWSAPQILRRASG